MHIEDRSVQDLTQDPDNARGHDAKNVEAIVQSLEAFGQQKPIIIDKEGKVVAGNGTLQAAKRLGWKSIKAVVTRLEGANQLAYAIADNRTAELAHWNDEQLAETLAALENDDSIDAAITGFSSKDIDKMIEGLADSGEIEEDEIPEVVTAVTQPGDLYLLGDHRLLCGDSTKTQDVDRLMNEEKAVMVFTDPPYALFGNSTGVAKVTDDKMARSFFRDCLTQCRRVTKRYGHIYVCCDWHSAFSIEAMSRECDLAVKNLIVWDKGDGGVGNMYQNCHEFVWFFSNAPIKKNTKQVDSGERVVNGIANIWRFTRISAEKRHHNAAKPVELVEIPLGTSCDRGDLVLDLFAGSGTVMIAAEQTGRRCNSMEVEPKWCDVIVKRWENLTGEKAERISAGG